MEYNKISYLEKLEKLRGAYPMSVALAKALGVSRTSLVNWLDKPDSISSENRFHIDVLYCKHFVVPKWDNSKESFPAVLLPDSMTHNDAVMMPFLRKMSYGTIEIETGMSQEDFDRAIDATRLPKNMSAETFYEAFNTFFTVKGLWAKIVERGELFDMYDESIKVLHESFMRGIREDAGAYSKNQRIMGQLEHFETTWPEDIPEEVYRWVFKYKGVSSLADIAKAHAHFIAIHPFGDGNGRVGRALVMALCLNARLMPPVFNGENRAMYYAAMEHAMVNGRHAPLIRLFYEAAKSV